MEPLHSQSQTCPQLTRSKCQGSSCFIASPMLAALRKGHPQGPHCEGAPWHSLMGPPRRRLVVGLNDSDLLDGLMEGYPEGPSWPPGPQGAPVPSAIDVHMQINENRGLPGAAAAGDGAPVGLLEVDPKMFEEGAPAALVFRLLDEFYEALGADIEALAPLQQHQQQQQQHRPKRWGPPDTPQYRSELLTQLQQLRAANKQQQQQQQQQQKERALEGVEVLLLQGAGRRMPSRAFLQGLRAVDLGPSGALPLSVAAETLEALKEGHGALPDSAAAAAVLLRRRRNAAAAAAAARQRGRSSGRSRRGRRGAHLFGQRRGPSSGPRMPKRPRTAALDAVGEAPLKPSSSSSSNGHLYEELEASVAAGGEAAPELEGPEAAACWDRMKGALGGPSDVSLEALFSEGPQVLLQCCVCKAYFRRREELLDHVGPLPILAAKRLRGLWGPLGFPSSFPPPQGAPLKTALVGAPFRGADSWGPAARQAEARRRLFVQWTETSDPTLKRFLTTEMSSPCCGSLPCLLHGLCPFCLVLCLLTPLGLSGLPARRSRAREMLRAYGVYFSEDLLEDKLGSLPKALKAEHAEAEGPLEVYVEDYFVDGKPKAPAKPQRGGMHYQRQQHQRGGDERQHQQQQRASTSSSAKSSSNSNSCSRMRICSNSAPHQQKQSREDQHQQQNSSSPRHICAAAARAFIVLPVFVLWAFIDSGFECHFSRVRGYLLGILDEGSHSQGCDNSDDLGQLEHLGASGEHFLLFSKGSERPPCERRSLGGPSRQSGWALSPRGASVGADLPQPLGSDNPTIRDCPLCQVPREQQDPQWAVPSATWLFSPNGIAANIAAAEVSVHLTDSNSSSSRLQVSLRSFGLPSSLLETLPGGPPIQTWGSLSRERYMWTVPSWDPPSRVNCYTTVNKKACRRRGPCISLSRCPLTRSHLKEEGAASLDRGSQPQPVGVGGEHSNPVKEEEAAERQKMETLLRENWRRSLRPLSFCFQTPPAATAASSAAPADEPYVFALEAAAAEEAAARAARKRSLFAPVYEGGLCIQTHLVLLQQQQLQRHLEVARKRFKAVLAAAAAAATAATADGDLPGGAPAVDIQLATGDEAIKEDASTEPHKCRADTSQEARTAQQQQQQKQQQPQQQEHVSVDGKPSRDEEHSAAFAASVTTVPAKSGASKAAFKRRLLRGIPGAPLLHGRRSTLRVGPRVGASGALREIDGLLRPTGLGLSPSGASSLPLSVACSKSNRTPYEHHALLVGAFCLSFSSLYTQKGGPSSPIVLARGRSPQQGSPHARGPSDGKDRHKLSDPELRLQGPSEGLHGQGGPPFLGPLNDATAADLRVGRGALDAMRKAAAGEAPFFEASRDSRTRTRRSSSSSSNSSSSQGFSSCLMHTCLDTAAFAAEGPLLPEVDVKALARVVPCSAPLVRTKRRKERPSNDKKRGPPTTPREGASEKVAPGKGPPSEGSLVSRSGRRSVPPSLFDA
ncbi:hypothetical protein Emag_006185 [Eimeria magna]